MYLHIMVNTYAYEYVSMVERLEFYFIFLNTETIVDNKSRDDVEFVEV